MDALIFGRRNFTQWPEATGSVEGALPTNGKSLIPDAFPPDVLEPYADVPSAEPPTLPAPVESPLQPSVGSESFGVMNALHRTGDAGALAAMIAGLRREGGENDSFVATTGLSASREQGIDGLRFGERWNASVTASSPVASSGFKFCYSYGDDDRSIYSRSFVDHNVSTSANLLTGSESDDSSLWSSAGSHYFDTTHAVPIIENGGGAEVLDVEPGWEVGENGSSVTTTIVSASGDQRINGLLYGQRWNATFITYSDPDASSDYQAGYNYDGNGNGISVQNDSFSRFSSQQMIGAHFALNQAIYTQPAGAGGFSVEGFTNLAIDYDVPGTGSGTLRFGNSSDPGTSYAFYPQAGVFGGDVWIGPSARTPTAGNYAWHTSIHEIGHALGLKHGQETGGPGNTALPAAWDAMEFSVMTYRSYVGAPLIGGYSNETWGYAQTWMMLDIAALQYLYGADYSTNSTDTTYTWSPTTGQSFVNGALAISPGGNRIFSTIWDGGGIDTYDMSNYSTAVSIDLGAGGWSITSPAQRAQLGNGNIASGTVYNALLFNGNTASLIENATGGSGNDTLVGNQLGNVLNGGTGQDAMSGLGGDDYYVVDNSGDVVIEQNGAGTDSVLSFIFEHSLASNVEILALQGSAVVGRGNAANNYIYGTNNVNYIDGQAGVDYMAGGGGDDIYWVENAGDVVYEDFAGGSDFVYSALFEYTLSTNVEGLALIGGATIGRGNNANNYLFGSDFSNFLDGGAGSDYMTGYGGDDRYYIDSAFDAVFENAEQGTDTAYSFLTETNLWANVESLIMLGGAEVGRGNNLNNYVYGTDATNYIDGGAGADYMTGYSGNDYYWVDNVGDAIFEAAGSGIDTVYSSASDYTLAANVEALALQSGAITGRGNSANNYLFGNSANNYIDGLGGSDYMVGGAGDDYYWVDDLNDLVIEGAGEGFDTVLTSVLGYVLSANVESVIYIGSIGGSDSPVLDGISVTSIWQNSGNLSIV